MRYAIILCMACSGTARAAPIPKESEAAKIKRVWGEPVVKDDGAKYTLDGDKLKITVPKGLRTCNGAIVLMEPDDAPRIVRKADVPFVATVTLHHHNPPENHPEANPKLISGAGIYVRFENTSAYSVGRIHNDLSMKTKGNAISTTFGFFDKKANGRSWQEIRSEQRFDPIGLRVVVEEGWIHTYFSVDKGKTWQGSSSDDRMIGTKAIVGVYAEHSVNAETTAIFEGFAITKPKK